MKYFTTRASKPKVCQIITNIEIFNTKKLLSALQFIQPPEYEAKNNNMFLGFEIK